MEYLTVKEAREKWTITGGIVTYCCAARRIKGTIKKGNRLFRLMWKSLFMDVTKRIRQRTVTAYEYYPTD
ncbi:hypothetical protein BS101_20275 [Clostridium kluyveri]|uniref:Uncharacterized protein n=1 Tax=Clostridium kluyveri TaxID=1534 RepID=A0A1L5FCZ2_CLOKL|nr:hypothetical protein BS101_20275 [Clostridium kluyveri]